MLDSIRKLFLSINAKAQNHALGQDIRRLVLLTLRSKGKLAENIAGLQKIADFISAETGAWMGPEDVAAGHGGHFDACDLRHWLAVAARAGVDAVPARVILTLSEEEMSAASGQIPGISEPYRAKLAAAAKAHLPDISDQELPEHTVDPDRLADVIASAMDDIPEGWMVRHVRCGPSTLKTLAGVGIAGAEAPETRFGPDLEIGPGWIRRGNRRFVDTADRRIVEGYAHGPDGPSVFVARPWVRAARFMIGEDPHRHGSQFAGKGVWPAEWRALVQNDKVVGVAFYYGWCGGIDPQNAAMALAVRDAAQKMVDEAVRQRVIPLYLDTEIARTSEHFKEVLDAHFARDKVACTLDFIETQDGVMFLEGGPPSNPYIGGGHPCAWAGNEGNVDGVAFRCMDGISLADPKTWKEPHDRTGAILTWAETEALAAEYEPTSAAPVP